MVQTKGQIIENSNLLFRLHHQRFYPKEFEKTLLSVEEFCTYLGIGKTKARELLSNPSCKYVVRIGRRVLIHKELLDAELKKSAKFQLKM